MSKTGNLPLDRHAQLIACAGAGKTERVARRVIDQLRVKGVTPANIVAFTFNERAAAELKDRISRRWEEATGSRDGLADLYVGTIHGFCLDLMQQNEFEVLPYRVLNDIQQRHLISRYAWTCGLTDLGWHPFFNASTYAELVGILREADIDEKVLRGSEVEECLDKYVGLLGDQKYLDFSAILFDAVDLLENDEDFRDRIRDRVKFLTVDEYQDVNPVQERLVENLAELGAKITVVGDDDQLLYGWRGSDVNNILNFAKRYDDVKTSKLEQNFRSSRGVVDLADHLIQRNAPDRLDKVMVSAGEQDYHKGDIELADFANAEGEAAHIVTRLESLLGAAFSDRLGAGKRGLSFADMAVLVRVKKLIPPIVEALEKREIPYVVGGVANLFETPEADAARHLFYFLAGEVDEAGLRAAWKRANLGLSKAELDRGMKSAVRNRRAIENDQRHVTRGSGRFEVYNLQRAYLDFLETIELREEKVIGASTSHAHSRSEVVFYNFGKFSELISDFEQIHFRRAPKTKYRSFAGFLRHQAGDLYPEGWLEARYVSPDAVQVMTIHQAKGLQWPAVFIPGLTKNVFPPKAPGGRSPWSVIPDGVVKNEYVYKTTDEDERRLLYVACTRAKKYLTITRADYHKPKQVWRTPSTFWLELDEAFRAIDPPEVKPRRRKLDPRPEHAMADVTLSFSELKYAFECPYSFKLRFLYGFNPPIAEPLGYGKSLHDALFELHDRALRGKSTDLSVVPELIDRHVFLPFAYDELRDKLTASATQRLEAYIQERAATFSDIEYAERPVEIDLGDGIRVTGRVDLIRRRSTDEVVVIDFKSNDRVQQEDVTALQLRVYALGYKQATGEQAAEVTVENLDELDNPQTTKVDDAMLTEATAAVRQAGTRMRANDYPRSPQGSTPKARETTCGRCDLEGICGGVTERFRFAEEGASANGKRQMT